MTTPTLPSQISAVEGAALHAYHQADFWKGQQQTTMADQYTRLAGRLDAAAETLKAYGPAKQEEPTR